MLRGWNQIEYKGLRSCFLDATSTIGMDLVDN
jgi:hypothetical protein